MRLPETVYRRLVVCNTAVLLGLMLVALVGAYKARDNLHRRLNSLVEGELAASRLFGPGRAAADAGFDTPVDIPLYDLQLGPQAWRDVQLQVQKLLAQRVMTNADKVWHPVRLLHEGERYKGKIRLRGDLPNHWAGGKKSWRIKLKKDKLLHGIRELDLIIPADRAFEQEKVAHDAARELGVLAADAGFCLVRINGVDMGLYLWVEKYGPEMLEKLGYPAGEIFREDNTWTQRYHTRFGLPFRGEPARTYSYFAANFTNTIRDDSALGFYAQRWDRFLSVIRDEDPQQFARAIPHLLDVEKYLTWNALSWLCGGPHCHWGDNLRWYYDDSRGLFEPILNDVYRHELQAPVDGSFESTEYDGLAKRIMHVRAYRQRRNEILWKLLNDPRFDLAASSERYYRAIRPHLLHGVDAHAGPDLDDAHRKGADILASNRDLVKANLEYARVFVTPRMTLNRGIPCLKVELLPDSLSAIHLRHCVLRFARPVADAISAGAVRLALTDPDGHESPLAPRSVSVADDGRLRIELDDLRVWSPLDEKLRPVVGEWTLGIQLPGIPAGDWTTPGYLAAVHTEFGHSLTDAVIDDQYKFQFPLVYDFADESAAEQAGPVSVDEFVRASGLPFRVSGDRLSLPAGEHVIRRDLVLPYDFGLRLEAGVVLRMAPAVSVVTFGPLEVAGEKDRPVRIQPLHDDRPWGSMGVVRARRRSRVSYLAVHGGSQARIAGLFFSGQLCFYSSDVDLENCTIGPAHADDGLNVKRADFTIQRCVFRGNASDAFDGDWVRGIVNNCAFQDNGGDGIDLSGSDVRITNCLLARSGDKGLSVGEKSAVTCFNSIIRECATGAAIKDLSSVSIYASVLCANETALSLHQKKQIFGPATGTAMGTLFWKNRRDFLLGPDSRLEVYGIGVEQWQPPPGVIADDVRQGPPARYYHEHENGHVQYNHLASAESPFAHGPHTNETAEGGSVVPDLSRTPIGLAHPLEQPDEFCPQIRAQVPTDTVNLLQSAGLP